MPEPARIDLFRWQFRYLDAARIGLLAAAETLDEAALRRPRVIAGGNGDGTVLAGLVHICDGEEVWFGQWTGDHADLDWGADTTLAVLTERWEALATRRTAWLARLTDVDLDATTPLQRGDSAAADLPLWARLIHLLDHTATHRGEVCAGMTALGVDLPEFDPFLFAITDFARPTVAADAPLP
jgi:uncharacterized damage-inducible protein DinB